MKRKLMALCTVIVAISVVFTISGGSALKNNSAQDVSYIERPQYYNEAADMNTTMNEAGDMNSTASATTPVDNYLDGKLEGFSAVRSVIGGLFGGDETGEGESSGSGLGSGLGIGDGIGSIGGIFGGVFGGGTGTTASNTVVVTYSTNNSTAGYIEPVPAATYTVANNNNLPSAESTLGTTSVVVSQVVTLNNNTTTNPYQKPAGTINPGDSGEGVKWIQWIFYYTGYGLDENSITGVYDENTQALVKKLQGEKGLTADGIVNDATIDKIELLYYEFTVTQATSAVVGIITIPETVGTTGDGAADETDSFGLVVAIVAAIWCLVIIIIIVLFILKKKKKSKKDNGQKAEVKEETRELTENIDADEILEEVADEIKETKEL